MKTIYLILMGLLIVAGAMNPLWAQNCPEAETATEQYIEVDAFPDLKNMGASVDNIPNINLHEEEIQEFKGYKIKIFYRLWKPFDPQKQTIAFILGGPGQTSEFMSVWIPKYGDQINNYNIVIMDHRVTGCSRTLFYEYLPPTGYKMRFAAADLEQIRKKLIGNKKWNVDGASYGSELALTYALLFPNSVDKLMIWGASSSYLDARAARRSFLPRLLERYPDLNLKLRELDSYNPEFTFAFLRYCVSVLFETAPYETIPNKIEEILSLLRKGDIVSAQALLPTTDQYYQAPYMQNNIMCLELEPYPLLPTEMRFYSPLETCRVFSKYFDYFNYTDSLALIQSRVFFWQGALDPYYDPVVTVSMSQKFRDVFFYLVPEQGHGIGKKRECYNKIYFSFLSGAANSELEKMKCN